MVAQAIRTVQEHIEVGDGARGKADDRVIRVKDIKGDSDLRFNIPGNQSATIGEVFNSFANEDVLPAPTLTNLVAAGTFAAVYLSWDIPSNGSYSYTEIWRSNTDNLTTAVKLGTAIVGVYADYIPTDTTYYYWVRAVNPIGTPGAYNLTPGTAGVTSPDPAFLLDQLTGEISSSQLDQDLRAQMDNLDSQYVVKVGSNGRMAGFGIAADDTTVPDPTFTFEVLADRFAVVNASGDAVVPFVIDGNNTYISDALIKNASITSAKIASLAADKINAGNINVALNLTASSITGGTIDVGPVFIDQTRMIVGEANIDGTGLVITEEYIQVWQSGVKRVEIGLLT